MGYQIWFLQRGTDCYYTAHRLGYQSRWLVNAGHNHPDKIVEFVDIRSGWLLTEPRIPENYLLNVSR